MVFGEVKLLIAWLRDSRDVEAATPIALNIA